MKLFTVRLATTLLAFLPLAARAQDPARVEALAPLLMAEDRRDFDATVLNRGLADPDAYVRQTAVTTIGRIGDRRGSRLVVTMLTDPDRGVVTAAFFALGLLHDTTTTGAIIARLVAPDSLGADAVGEAATALARIGGPAAARFITVALTGGGDLPRTRTAPFVLAALLDGWKLGALMPGAAMLHFADDTSVDLRWRAIYSLGRVRSPLVGRVLQNAIRDPIGLVRETAAKWLTKRLADTAALPQPGVKAALVRALDDDQPGVRINAVTSLATFGDSLLVPKVVPLLADGDPNVRVAAATALGDMKGTAAQRALAAIVDKRDGLWALRRTALLALAKADTAAFASRVAVWSSSADVRDRLVGVQAWGTIRGTPAAPFRAALADRDDRVQAAALEAWRSARADSAALAIEARSRLRSPSAGVRAAAAMVLREAVTIDDVDALIAAWRASQVDAESDGRLAIIADLQALSRRSPQLMAMLEEPSRRALFDRPRDPVVVSSVSTSWPQLAEHWGARYPIETRLSLEDYRMMVRTYLLAADDPRITIEVQGRGVIEVQLLAHEAPLTVANFLKLVDRHYFDGNAWHRVVPNFVVQDGDRTGTGNGGPGWAIRDEINRERYALPMLGMALSGADTGGSQWFINLSAQPHLDGQYTIFGKVTGSYAALAKISQGDVIRSIHR